MRQGMLTSSDPKFFTQDQDEYQAVECIRQYKRMQITKAGALCGLHLILTRIEDERNYALKLQFNSAA